MFNGSPELDLGELPQSLKDCSLGPRESVWVLEDGVRAGESRDCLACAPAARSSIPPGLAPGLFGRLRGAPGEHPGLHSGSVSGLLSEGGTWGFQFNFSDYLEIFARGPWGQGCSAACQGHPAGGRGRSRARCTNTSGCLSPRPGSAAPTQTGLGMNWAFVSRLENTRQGWKPGALCRGAWEGRSPLSPSARGAGGPGVESPLGNVD